MKYRDKTTVGQAAATTSMTTTAGSASIAKKTSPPNRSSAQDNDTKRVSGRGTTQRLAARKVISKQKVYKFNCNLCGRAFNDKSNLRRHRATHDPSTAMAYSCKVCGRGFRRKGNLDVHLRNVDCLPLTWYSQSKGHLTSSSEPQWTKSAKNDTSKSWIAPASPLETLAAAAAGAAQEVRPKDHERHGQNIATRMKLKQKPVTVP